MDGAKQRLLSIAAVGLALLTSSFHLVQGEEEDSEPVTLAVITNLENPATDLKWRDFRKLMRVDKLYWEGQRRCVLYLPATDSDTRAMLLDKVYSMNEEELRRYWTTKVFSGDIPREPTVARTAKAAGILVAKAEGGLSVVLATEVPKGVKVLQIDGKKPGDEGYALMGVVKRGAEAAADFKNLP